MTNLDLKHTGRFFLSAFWMDFSGGMFVVALPFLAMSLGAESRELGIVGASRGVAFLIIFAPAVLLVDRYPRPRLVAMSALGVAVSVLLIGGSVSLWQVCAICGLWSAALAVFWPAVFAWLGDSHEPEELGRAAGAVNMGWSIGGTLGGVLGGWLFGIRPSLPFVVAALPALLALVSAPRRAGRRHRPAAPPPRGPRKPGVRRRLAAAWIGSASICCLLGLMSGVFPKLGAEIGVTSAAFGVLIGASSVTRTGVFFAGLRGAVWPKDWRASCVAQVIAAGMVMTVCKASAHWWLAVVFATAGASVGVSYFASLYASLEDEGSRLMKSAIHEAAIFGGVLLGTLGGGEIAHAWGVRAPYVPMGLFVLALVAVQVALNLWAQAAGKRVLSAE